MKKFCVALLTIAVLFTTACGQKAPTWQEQYDLGVRYLEDGNYEEAIIAFTAAIEIDPNNTESYLRLADIYSELTDYENAKLVLEKGFENTEDEVIKTKLNELLEEHLSLLLKEDVDYANDFLVGGKPVTNCTLADIIAAYPSAKEEEWYYDPIRESSLDEGMIQYRQRVKTEMHGFSDGVVAGAVSNDSPLNWLSFQYENSPAFDFREIALGDSFEDVIRKLGFNEDSEDYLKDYSSINVHVSNEYVYFRESLSLDGVKEICIFDDEFHLWFQFKDNSLSQFDYYADP